ncbi:TlpA family protein disulfide reductase [Endothiovibrio diazotrophicus]
MEGKRFFALLLVLGGGVALGYWSRGASPVGPNAEAAVAAVSAPSPTVKRPAAPGLAVDDPAPALRLPDLEGADHGLEEWRGKTLLVNFWASWCAPCQYEIRDLVRFQERYAGQGLQVIGVGVDDPAKLANVRRTLGINYPVLVAGEANTRLLSHWGNDQGVVPYNVVITPDGKVHELIHGSLDREGFNDLVLPLLGR